MTILHRLFYEYDIIPPMLIVSIILGKTTSNHAIDIFEAMWTGRPNTFYINTRNTGAVSNMTGLHEAAMYRQKERKPA